MIAGSLFTGIGGLDLGLIWSGLVTTSPRRVGWSGASPDDAWRSGSSLLGLGSAQPSVGSRADGFPSLVVRWPAGPTEAQHPWEPPRTLAGVTERAAKLKAIGNAVSPVQAYYVGLWAREVLSREPNLYDILGAA